MWEIENVWSEEHTRLHAAEENGNEVQEETMGVHEEIPHYILCKILIGPSYF